MRCIVFFSENQAVVEIINRQTSEHRYVMVLLRHFVLSALKYNILFHAKHIAGSLNHESDALSSLQVEKFRFLVPYADDQQTPIPGGLTTHQSALHMTELLCSPITESSHKTCESEEDVCGLCNRFW